MNHQLLTPDECDCADESVCNICAGGLALCKICGGAEAAMPKECPGEKMKGDVLDKIQAGQLDYVNGEWVSTLTKDQKRTATLEGQEPTYPVTFKGYGKTAAAALNEAEDYARRHGVLGKKHGGA